jgi:hypothetical protein
VSDPLVTSAPSAVRLPSQRRVPGVPVSSRRVHRSQRPPGVPMLSPACRCRPNILMSASTSRCRPSVLSRPSTSRFRRVVVSAVPGVVASCPPFPASSGVPMLSPACRRRPGVLWCRPASRRVVISAVPGVVTSCPRFPASSRHSDVVPGVSASSRHPLMPPSVPSRRRPGVLVPASSSVPRCIRRLAVVCVVVSASSLVLSSRPSSLPASSPPCRSCRPHGLFFSVGC